MEKPWLLEAAQPYRPVSLTAAAVDSPFYRALKRMFARPNQLCGLGDRLDYAGVFAGTALSDGSMSLYPNVVSFTLHVVSIKYLEQLKMIPWFAECEIKNCPDTWSEQMGKFKRGKVKISCAFPRAQAEDLYKLFYIDGFKRIPAELLSLCSAGSRISRSTPDFLGAIMCGDGAVTDIVIDIALHEQCRGSLGLRTAENLSDTWPRPCWIAVEQSQSTSTASQASKHLCSMRTLPTSHISE